MRQVPNYLLIGNGRLARHFAHYFSLLQLPFLRWYRPHPVKQLIQQLQTASHVLLLINDSAIEAFINEHLNDIGALLIHCSGSLVCQFAFSAHPLSTFNDKLYSLETYQTLPFILEKNTLRFAELLPGLPNPHFYLDPKQKAKYHALCVLSGNFSCLLWQKLFSSFEQEFGLPAEAAHCYLQQQTTNLLQDYKSALTGPLARKDKLTIQNNLRALAGDAFQEIYQSFVTNQCKDLL